MATFDRYILQLAGPLHLNSRGIGIEATDLTVRSDTLFSALCVGIAETQGASALEDLLEWYNAGEAPFFVSSTFPWAGALSFLPRPRIVSAGGVARRARWVTAAILGRLLQGGDLSGEDDERHFLPESGAWMSTAERGAAVPPLPWWTVDQVPRVSLDRATQASAVYRCGRAIYRAEAGLYFLVDWRERAWEPAFDAALAYLADGGIGGERSAGHGQFRLRTHDRFEIPDVPDAPTRFTLGLYHPTRTEVAAGALADPACFDLEARGGWMAGSGRNGVWRRSVRMLAEGALVRTGGGTPGDLVDVTPEGYLAHRVYRYGVALTLGAASRPGRDE